MQTKILKNVAHLLFSCTATVGAMAQGISFQMSSEQEQRMLEQLIAKHPAVAASALDRLSKGGSLDSGLLSGVNANSMPAAPVLAPATPLPLSLGSGSTTNAATLSGNPSEEELARFISALPRPTGSLEIERQRDGFLVNGNRHIDPEGKIVAFAHDVLSGDITYVVATNPGSATLKYMRATATSEPVTIGAATKGGLGWTVKTNSGKTLSGNNVIPTSRGFLVTRANTAFMYRPGLGVTNIAAPEEFDIAAFQNGDVASTEYVLLERRAAPKSDSIAQLTSIFSVFGKKEDYFLFNIKSGEKYAINISISGKSVNVMSDCRPVNGLINSCKNMDSYESLYQANGARNIHHYFWRINWYQSSSGPILIAHENNTSDVNITDLNSGKKVNALNRGLGISSYNSYQTGDGKIRISARLGFSTETIADARSVLDTREAIVEK